MPAERFLLQQRCRAEANLIKARIAYKVHSNLDLSENEKRYLAQWMEAASQTNAILSTADILVPEEPCSLSLAEALTPEDFYMLNSLSRVSIQGEQRDAIAVSDLVLELANFVDEQTVRKVELQVLEDSLKSKWKLNSDFRLVERRNKEIDHLMREMEEVAWRAAGQFNAKEK